MEPHYLTATRSFEREFTLRPQHASIFLACLALAPLAAQDPATSDEAAQRASFHARFPEVAFENRSEFLDSLWTADSAAACQKRQAKCGEFILLNSDGWLAANAATHDPWTPWRHTEWRTIVRDSRYNPALRPPHSPVEAQSQKCATHGYAAAYAIAGVLANTGAARTWAERSNQRLALAKLQTLGMRAAEMVGSQLVDTFYMKHAPVLKRAEKNRAQLDSLSLEHSWPEEAYQSRLSSEYQQAADFIVADLEADARASGCVPPFWQEIHAAALQAAAY